MMLMHGGANTSTNGIAITRSRSSATKSAASTAKSAGEASEVAATTTFPPILVSEGLGKLGLCALEPPVSIAPMPMRFLWSFRLTNDPGSKWFREFVTDTFDERSEAGGSVSAAPSGSSRAPECISACTSSSP